MGNPKNLFHYSQPVTNHCQNLNFGCLVVDQEFNFPPNRHKGRRKQSFWVAAVFHNSLFYLNPSSSLSSSSLSLLLVPSSGSQSSFSHIIPQAIHLVDRPHHNFTITLLSMITSACIGHSISMMDYEQQCLFYLSREIQRFMHKCRKVAVMAVSWLVMVSDNNH